MKCQVVRPLLYRLIEDRLLVSDESAIRTHVDGCADCALRFRQIAALDESAMEAETQKPSAHLRSSLLATYRRLMADRRTSSSIWAKPTAVMRRAAMFALVAVGSGTATWLGVRQNHPSSVPPAHVKQTTIALDHVFPLRFSTTYTVQDEDGRTQRGVNIQLVQ